MSSQQFLEAKTSRIFPVPAETVFDAWINPEMIGRWMFGPAVRDEEVVSIEVDPKVGGEFSFLVRRNQLVIDHIGSYLRIDHPTHLEFKWGVKGMADSSRVIVEITQKGSGCELSLLHELDPSWHEYLQRSIEGWSHMLAKLEDALRSSTQQS